MNLSTRKMRILKAIIDDYIATAVPVGSRTISKRYVPDLSSATIRNEMSDLEEMGLLEQPHTSAGRIPSDLAYRYYVDSLMSVGELEPEEARSIREYFSDRMGEMEQVVKNAARVLSDMTDYTSLVITPQLAKAQIRRVQLVPVARGMALAVIVTDTVLAKDAIIRVPDNTTDDELAAISDALTRCLQGKTLGQATNTALDEIRRSMQGHRQLLDSLFNTLCRSTDRDSDTMVMEGAYNIFHHPEFKNDMERARVFLNALQTRDKLYEIMAGSTSLQFTITIGRENPIEEFKDTSVVTATYRIGGRALGSIGVIGPTRMDYRRVVNILDHISHALGETMSQLFGDEADKEDQ